MGLYIHPNPIYKSIHKKDLIALLNYSTSLKAILFISLQIAHNKRKGAALHTFFRFLPMKEPCQLRNYF